MPTPSDTRVRDRALCILLVEDDDADAYLVERALTDNKRVGKVVRAHHGQHALEMLQSGEVAPDFAILDLNMPMMGGLELLVALVDQGLANIPVVVLTSSSAPSDAIRSRVRGALRVMTKPDSIRELYTMLENAIDSLCRPESARDDVNLGRAHYYLPTELPDAGASKGLRRADAPGQTPPVFGRKA